MNKLPEMSDRQKLHTARFTLEAVRLWFDTDPEILAGMSKDELADHKRQLAKIETALKEIAP